MTRGQPHELITLAEQKRVGADNQSAALCSDNGCEGRVDFAFGAGVQDIDLHSERAAAACTSRTSAKAGGKFGLISIAIAVALGTNWRISSSRFDPTRGNNGRAREIAARLVETGHEPSLDWVAAESEDDRYGGRCRLGCQW